jgi:hypothetical protein
MEQPRRAGQLGGCWTTVVPVMMTGVSFDLMVLAIDADAGAGAVRAMLGRCQGNPHPEGELDERIVAFYEQLRSRFPDDPAGYPQCPWMSMPLSVGVDHVFCHISLSPRGTTAIDAITRLAAIHGLTVYDPQSDDVYSPAADEQRTGPGA